MNRTVMFELERETKNTYRYREAPKPGEPRVIGALYLQKWMFEGKPPVELKVEVQST